jgi:hypothetical protein
MLRRRHALFVAACIQVKSPLAQTTLQSQRNLVKTLGPVSIASLFFVSVAVPAMAGVTIGKPSNNAQVSSPFKLSAWAPNCASQNVSAMGYSFDSSSDTTVVKGQSIDWNIDSSSGHHTLHVKAWGDDGSSCVADIDIDVSAGGSGGSDGALIPPDAESVGHLDAMSGWHAQHDDGGPGAASGWMKVVGSPSVSGSAREFETQFSNGGDERYSLSFSDDVNATHFFYDAWVYLTSSSNHIGNLEFDINQTMPDGKTAMFGVVCDGYSEHWAYTVNEGSDSDPSPVHVTKSGAYCDPRAWSQYKWHHVQAYYSHDDSGYITYHSVWLDGTEFKIDETVFGKYDLGWGPTINTQFQVDGVGSSGHSTVYVASLNVSRW